MRLIYIASAEIACPVLDRLAAQSDIELVQVITQPDRPRGRRRKLSPCAVKQRALELGLPVSTPEKIAAPDAVAHIRALKADLALVFAYGQYLPASVTEAPALRSINIHPSLLPRYRGAAPIQWAIAHGDSLSGVTILYVSKEMDAGDILLQREIPIQEDDTSATLGQTMADAGAELALEAMRGLAAGTLRARPQDPEQVTIARKLTKEDGRLDWTRPAEELQHRIRAFTPWPGCYFPLPGRDPGTGPFLKVWKSKVEATDGLPPPGELLDTCGPGPLIAAASGSALRLLRVQPPGKKPMPGDAFLRGQDWAAGLQLF